jgi:ABC-type uncharacterized transport system involved in gliding motility auxiliary subunit
VESLMKTDWIRSRQTQYGAYATVYIVIVIAALALLNFLANRHNKSIDTTAEKKFTLSDQTRKVIGGLKQDLRILFFDQQSRFPGARDILDRYETLSPKVKIDYIDPDRKPELARQYGVRNAGLILVESGGKRQEAKSLTEEDITGAIIRTLKNDVRTVCVVGGSGEPALDDTGRDGYSNAKQLIESDNYQIRTISLLDQPEVPKNCSVLIVAGPKFDYLDPSIQAIKTYVEAGGRALLMLDTAVKVGREPVAENAKLLALLAEWGVTLNKDLVLDTSGVGQLYGFSAAVPLVRRYEQHPIVREFRGIATAFPLARSLDAKNGAKTQVSPLFSTTENSFAVSNIPAGGSVQFQEGRDKKGPLTLGVAGTYDTGKPQNEGRFVVVGSAAWMGNSIIGFNGNRNLALNMLNWLSSDEELISIRPKDPADRRLALNGAQRRVLSYTTLIALPLILVAGGIGVWWKRR